MCVVCFMKGQSNFKFGRQHVCTRVSYSEHGYMCASGALCVCVCVCSCACEKSMESPAGTKRPNKFPFLSQEQKLLASGILLKLEMLFVIFGGASIQTDSFTT